MNTTLSVKQAARLADVYECEIYAAIGRGLIKADYVGRRIFIDKESLEAFSQRRREYRTWRDSSSERIAIGA
jgi:hypothetical protein